MRQTKLLAIETSCDESAVALSVNGKISHNIVLSQEIHKLYGGVVPELAARAHDRYLTSLVDRLLESANLQASQLDALAFTQGPGLLGALLVGCAWAKAFAWANDLPLIAVDHLQAHVLSHFIDEPVPDFPFLALVASGGHTQLLHIYSASQMELLGETKDDAIGEAFDKAAKMLGLPYPGGPALDAAARHGNPNAFAFPRAEVPGLDYSFSGLKTSLLYFLRAKTSENPEFVSQYRADLSASVEYALVEALMEKLIAAQTKTGLHQVCVSGGAAANTALRKRLEQQSKACGWQLFVPELKYCTDNAAMVATAADFLYAEGRTASLETMPYARRPTFSFAEGRTSSLETIPYARKKQLPS